MAQAYFPNLDGLRFVAFFLVYLLHGFELREPYGASAAGAGVSFFFVLSGFLITFLILEEIDQWGKIDVLAFYARRCLRIWPLYYAVLAFAFIFYPLVARAAGFIGELQNGGPLLYVFFLSNFDVMRIPPGHGVGFTTVTWSVAIEEQFYLLWPLLFRAVPRRFFGAIFVIVILASTSFRVAHLDDPRFLYFHSLSVISDMAVGGVAAWLWRSFEKFRAFWTALPRWACLIPYAGALGFIVTGAFFGPFSRLVSASCFAAIVLEQNFCAASAFKMSRYERLSRLGRWTYGLYLLHMVALAVLAKGRAFAGVAPESLISILLSPWIGLALTIALAGLSYRYLERPFLNLKSGFSRTEADRGASPPGRIAAA